MSPRQHQPENAGAVSPRRYQSADAGAVSPRSYQSEDRGTLRRLSVLAALLMLVALVAGAYALTRPEANSGVRARVAVGEALGGDAAGFARALAPRPFVFPADHGPHPEYRTEWWYYTGNLSTATGRHFGYQLTFFRNSLPANPEPRASAWATNQVYMAHFALSDIDGGQFHAFERFQRGAEGLAGAQATPFQVWLEDWSAATVPGGAEPFPGHPAVRLRAAEGDLALDLTVATTKPAVWEGENGFSRKGPEPGNASYYYSLTRLDTTGTLTVSPRQYQSADAGSVDGQTFAVSGSSWLDREWGTSALSPDLVGWDWFALQLDDGRELMLYRLRWRDGTADPFSAGTLVAPDGSSRSLAAADFSLQPLGEWQSPNGGVRYPAAWRVAVPGANLYLTVTPYLADQELAVSVRYWEGAVRIAGSASGQGYLEMTGYGDSGVRR